MVRFAGACHNREMIRTKSWLPQVFLALALALYQGGVPSALAANSEGTGIDQSFGGSDSTVPSAPDGVDGPVNPCPPGGPFGSNAYYCGMQMCRLGQTGIPFGPCPPGVECCPWLGGGGGNVCCAPGDSNCPCGPCPGGETRVKGFQADPCSCGPCCPNARFCPSGGGDGSAPQCCDAGFACVNNNTCCAVERVCGSSCCTGSDVCVAGACQPPACPDGRARCGGACCQAGVDCINGSCGCPNGQTVCGVAPNQRCCPAGQCRPDGTCGGGGGSDGQEVFIRG